MTLTDALEHTHPAWHPILSKAIAYLNSDYVTKLNNSDSWFPGKKQIFNAFNLPLNQLDVILFGESPYPRQQSANGYAFWDANVGSIWSETGLSSQVNRATSLRNFIKMLLLTRGDLQENDLSQQAIAAIEKETLIKTLEQLFCHLIEKGFLLLNASLVYFKDEPMSKHVKAWQPFMTELLKQLSKIRPNIQLLLFGHLANTINKLPEAKNFKQLWAPHPYNISFIHDKKVQDFFRDYQLLKNKKFIVDNKKRLR